MRIVNIKPEFHREKDWYDLELNTGRLPVRLAYIALWGLCDCNGVIRWRPWEIKHDIAPYEEEAHFDKIIEVIEGCGRLMFFEADGERFGWIPSYVKHQRKDPKRTPMWPPPPKDLLKRKKFSTKNCGKVPQKNLPSTEKKPPNSDSKLTVEKNRQTVEIHRGTGDGERKGKGLNSPEFTSSENPPNLPGVFSNEKNKPDRKDRPKVDPGFYERQLQLAAERDRKEAENKALRRVIDA